MVWVSEGFNAEGGQGLKWFGLLSVGHTYWWWVETPGYIFQIGVSKHEALGLSLDLAWMWKYGKFEVSLKQGSLTMAI